MQPLNFAIVGSGLIARIIASSIAASQRAQLVAVSSRRQETADAFAALHPGVSGVVGLEALLRRDDVDAVYVATPTSTKTAIVLECLAAGKHVLVDKPLPGEQAVERMIALAEASGLVLMDATHFVHHPRTATLVDWIATRVGGHRSLHSAFYTALADPGNIRFNPALEPMGVVGDLGWYAMRAVVVYLRPAGELDTVAAVTVSGAADNVPVRAAGLLSFASGETSTFDVGYTANTAVMDLRLIGSEGVVSMDDFALDWANSFAYQNSNRRTGFSYRRAMATPEQFTFLETPSATPADVLMIDDFAQLVRAEDARQRRAYTSAMLATQHLLDAVWAATLSG